MGACFRAPCATPGQDGWKHCLCLTFSHCHGSFHLHKTMSMLPECAGIFVLMGCFEPLTISPKVKEKGKKNSAAKMNNEF